MKVGYVRISTKEQNTARQDVLMEKLGVKRVYTDKLSGKDSQRPELQKMMDFVREGDIVVVESFSRFARNTRDLLDLTAALEEKGVRFVSQKEAIDTDGPAGKLMLTIFGALAQFERETILERQAEGIAIAKAEGRMTGRPRKAVDTFEDVYLDYKNGKISAAQGAKKLGIARSTWYRKVKELAAIEADNEEIDFG
ncbi:recombinase family protein [Pseudoflavonifractor phocaeensis]|uniref:recombinase family protein n=1 Tax=Pseudoflavonifractor phocaeensis TaxID=1870988 RepID=UPI001958453C|nr:recombinase family protein [Pseudoflavonifractor phocaeensis]MBM6722328.1 recombinase family protein [Pseudoflavonifractor phocaeensis]